MMTCSYRCYREQEKPYACKNFRPNKDCFQMPGACHPSQGQVIADLYDAYGKFHRSAVVADCRHLQGAIRYCEEQNARVDKEAVDKLTPTVCTCACLKPVDKKDFI